MPEKNPLPWKVNPAWEAYCLIDTFGATPAPILDANGEEVFGTSEWLTIEEETVYFIIEAANKTMTQTGNQTNG
jgi:hypothetical protein